MSASVMNVSGDAPGAGRAALERKFAARQPRTQRSGNTQRTDDPDRQQRRRECKRRAVLRLGQGQRWRDHGSRGLQRGTKESGLGLHRGREPSRGAQQMERRKRHEKFHRRRSHSQ